MFVLSSQNDWKHVHQYSEIVSCVLAKTAFLSFPAPPTAMQIRPF